MSANFSIPCQQAKSLAIAHQNQLTKPQGSLGVLETLAEQFAAWQKKAIPDPIKPFISIFAADHGVTIEGISAFPTSVTAQMVENFCHGGAAICVLAQAHHAKLEIIDVGVNADTSHLAVLQQKIRKGSRNLAQENALTPEEVQQALKVGEQAVLRAIAEGANLWIAGEMGIGNTTPATALIAKLSNAQAFAGRGTGIDDQTLNRKQQVIERALQRIQDQTDPLAIAAAIGGYDIVAIAGGYLACAHYGIPCLIDGVITAAAALIAAAIAPEATQWMLASHQSHERAHRVAMDKLHLQPLIDFQLRLGEGSGAALVIPLIQAALTLHKSMATFSQAGVDEKIP